MKRLQKLVILAALMILAAACSSAQSLGVPPWSFDYSPPMCLYPYSGCLNYVTAGPYTVVSTHVQGHDLSFYGAQVPSDNGGNLIPGTTVFGCSFSTLSYSNIFIESPIEYYYYGQLIYAGALRGTGVIENGFLNYAVIYQMTAVADTFQTMGRYYIPGPVPC